MSQVLREVVCIHYVNNSRMLMLHKSLILFSSSKHNAWSIMAYQDLLHE